MLDDLNTHIRLGGERVQIIEIHDPAETRHRNFIAAPHMRADVHHVLCGQAPRIGKPRDHAQRGPIRMLRDCGKAFVKKPNVAAKLVDAKSLDQGRIRVRQNGFRANHLCNYAAAINVTG